MRAFLSPLRDPFEQFAQWFDHARRSPAIPDATAMVVATLDDGWPDARWVLLKSVDAAGFVFYTNLNSPKGHALLSTPRASLAFLWDFGKGVQRQVRIQGATERVSDAEADAYWASRPRLSQLGSLTSRQSEPLAGRALFLKELAKNALRYGTGPVPRPSHWSGFRVVPRRFEFWQARPNRLHDRFLYIPAGKSWRIQRLYP